MIPHRKPLIEARTVVLSADYLARRLLLVSGEDLFFAVILANDIEHIREAIVVVIRAFDVGAEESLSNRPCWVVLMERIDKAAQGLFGLFLVGVIVSDLISCAVDDHARMVAIAANCVANVDL